MFDTGVVYRNEDSYCGPISMLEQLPDGELLLLFREAKWRGKVTHADPTTRTCLLRSRDEGRTWFSQVTPDPTGGNGTALYRLSDGVLLANAFHWVFAPIAERERLAGLPSMADMDWLGVTRAAGGVFMTRSTTDGYTWDPPWRIVEPEAWPSMACHGAPMERPDGDLLLPVTARFTQDGQAHGAVLRSRDRGTTWGEAVCITDDAPSDITFHETRLVLCPSGRILAMHRTPKGPYYINASLDGGLTWGETRETRMWCGGSSPPDMKVLADGRILLTRGYRREPFGVRVHITEDEGETWPEANDVILRDDGLDRDVGYPSTQQLADGRLVTIYYWHNEDRIRHLQRTTWDLPGQGVS